MKYVIIGGVYHVCSKLPDNNQETIQDLISGGFCFELKTDDIVEFSDSFNDDSFLLNGELISIEKVIVKDIKYNLSKNTIKSEII
jgi:hypothetical protein